MAQTTRKTTSVSLTIGSPIKDSSRESQTSSTLIQPISLDPKKVCNPPPKHSESSNGTTPVFTKKLQNINAEKGQLVVFECRIQAKPPLQVHWYRENDPIIDSADFKILRKKTCLSSVPEEVCTLIIIESFPEDSGLFKCTAKNEYGEVSSSAYLFVPLDTEEYGSHHSTQNAMEINNQTNNCQINNNSDGNKKPTNSELQEILDLDNLIDCHKPQLEKNNITEDCEPTFSNPPASQKTCYWGEQPKESENKAKDYFQPNNKEGKKYSSEFYQSSTSTNSTQYRNNSDSMNITTLPSVSSIYQPSMFNYERPKHFIQSQPKSQAESMPKGGAATLPRMSSKKMSISIQPQSSNDLLSSPTYPVLQEQVAPSTFTSMKKVEAPEQQLSQTSANSLCGQKSASYQFKEQPAAFLCSVLPCNNNYNDSKSNSTSQPEVPKSIIKKVPKQQITERDIQGTKDALIQDLERKLKCKENVLHNGNQRLTYEERMARRLLGPQNAASVFEDQSTECLPDSKLPENMKSHPSHARSWSSSSAEAENRSIQEKFFPPRFLQVPEDLVVEEGRFCRIDFKVSGLPAPDVMWYLNGRPVQADDFHKMIVCEKGVHSFIFEVVQAHDAGLYKCVASNRAGEAHFTLQLDVLAQECRRPPCFIQKPTATRAIEGDNVTMECKVCAAPSPDILLKKNNEMLQYNTDRIRLLQDGSGKIYLSIYNVKKSDDGWYTISAVNDAGIATCHARLDVATRVNKPMPNTKQLKVRPTFSRYSALSGKGLDVQQAFSPDNQFHNPHASYPGLLESDEL
ncbi:LOW QUALITY PROTEIN: myotilin [Discoglossus pictus]